MAGDRLTVTWETIGNVPLVNVRFKNCMGIESSRGKTVLRFTKEQGELNKGTSSGGVPFDFPPGKYTLAVSDPPNNIRGMTFVSILRPISVADILEPPWGMKNLSWRNTTWPRGSTHTIKWKLYKGKASIVGCYVAIGPSSEGPWRVLRGTSDLKFRVPEQKRLLKDDGLLRDSSPGLAPLYGLPHAALVAVYPNVALALVVTFCVFRVVREQRRRRAWWRPLHRLGLPSSRSRRRLKRGTGGGAEHCGRPRTTRTGTMPSLQSQPS